MKKLLLFLTLLAIALIACTKVNPIQDECGIVWEVREKWTSPGNDGTYLSTDTVWCSQTAVCGQQFQNYKLESERGALNKEGAKGQWIPYCPNGITEYYEFWHVITSK